MLANALSEADLAQLRKNFERLDTNGDGVRVCVRVRVDRWVWLFICGCACVRVRVFRTENV